MGQKIELVFGYAEHNPGQIAVRVVLDGKSFPQHRDAGTPEGSRLALVIETTARKSGLHWTSAKTDPKDGLPIPVELFMSDPRFPPHATQARGFVDGFRDQGFAVHPTGGYLGGAVYTSSELVAMDSDEFYGRLAQEASHVAARYAARASREAEAVRHLQEAARAEELQETLPASTNVFALRAARRREDGGDAFRHPIDEEPDAWCEPDDAEPVAAFGMR